MVLGSNNSITTYLRNTVEQLLLRQSEELPSLDLVGGLQGPGDGGGRGHAEANGDRRDGPILHPVNTGRQGPSLGVD